MRIRVLTYSLGLAALCAVAFTAGFDGFPHTAHAGSYSYSASYSRSYSSPSYSYSRPSYSYSSPSYSYSRPSYSAPAAAPTTTRSPGLSFGAQPSRPAAATPTPALSFGARGNAPAPTQAASPYRPAQPYTVRSMTTSTSYKPAPVITAAPTRFATTTVRTGNVTIYQTNHFTSYSVRPAYASAYHYYGPTYMPGMAYQYHQPGFPWMEFWMWDSFYNQRGAYGYAPGMPTGYGPMMGANGQWAMNGPAVYDWRRDPCSPRRFFLVRWLFCHR